jgi:hypothetical protein
MKWEDMQGDRAVRFCGECKLNVHNLSSLPDEEVAALLKRKADGERVCTYFYRRDDGTIVTDNCPKQLKEVRTRVQAYAYAMAVSLCWMLASSADAQGLVGSPVDPRYGQSNQVGGLADYGYDNARDISRMVTYLSVVLYLCFGWVRSRKVNRKRLARELIAFALIPVFVHLAGTFYTNGLGGLSGGI